MIWTCKDCLIDCDTKFYYPDKTVQIGADKYCYRFFNPKAEKFYSERGREEWPQE